MARNIPRVIDSGSLNNSALLPDEGHQLHYEISLDEQDHLGVAGDPGAGAEAILGFSYKIQVAVDR